MTPSILHSVSLWIWFLSEEKPNSFQGPYSVCQDAPAPQPSFLCPPAQLPLTHLVTASSPSSHFPPTPLHLVSQLSFGHLCVFPPHLVCLLS